ncbi:MAG: hypothetical protein JO207_01960 [Verrucomicrobia bacterium]|nr:hypothetical protein [Verrucomicrobiota bacterium]
MLVESLIREFGAAAILRKESGIGKSARRQKLRRNTDRLVVKRVVTVGNFERLDDRTTRYYPLSLKLFPDPATRPRQREVLIEYYRKGKVDEAVRAFKKNYLEVVQRMVDHLERGESGGVGH